MKKVKNYIPTVIISIVIPLFYYFIYSYSYGLIYRVTEKAMEKQIVAVLCDIILKILCIAVWIIYYKIVVKDRKRDKIGNEKIKRTVCSLIIQFIIVLYIFLLLVNAVKEQPEKGHYSGELFFLLIIIILEPLLNLLWCTLIYKVFIKLPVSIFTKIKKRIHK